MCPKDDRPTPVGVPRPTLPNMKAVDTKQPVVQYKRLPEGASIEQMLHTFHEGMVGYAQLAADNASIARNYMDLVAECRGMMAQIHGLAERNYSEARAARGIAEDAAAEVVVVRAEIQVEKSEFTTELQSLDARLTKVEIFTGLVPIPISPGKDTPNGPASILPPMRPPSQSNNDLARYVSKAAVADIQAIRKNPSTPPGPLSNEMQEKIIEERVNAGLALRDAARLQKAEEARLNKVKQDEDDARAQRNKDADAKRDMRVRTWVAILALITTVVTILVSLLTRAPVRQVPLPIPVPTIVQPIST